VSGRPQLVVAALFALAVAAVAILIAAAHVQPVGHGSPAGHGNGAGGGPTFVVTQPPQPSASPADPRHAQANPLLAVVLVAGLLAVLAGILIVIWAVISTLRHRRLSVNLRARRPAPVEPAPHAVVDLDGAVDRALGELGAGGPVDDAIIRCWLQLAAAADAAGVRSDVSDTPEEAVGRMLAAGGVPAEPLRRLADLYREARFSRHRMTEADVVAARAALTSIVDDLRQGSAVAD
jgi:hypothetical protein